MVINIWKLLKKSKKFYLENIGNDFNNINNKNENKEFQVTKYERENQVSNNLGLSGK